MKEEIKEIVSGPPLKISYWPGSSEKLVVVFSGVGSNPHEYPPIEFFLSATEEKRNHALFISDIDRSWLNGDGVSDEIVDTINSTAKDMDAHEIHLIGNSMGGSMALLVKDQVPAKTVLSFVPQYSACPDIVPEEKRWMRFRKKIKHFKYPEITLSKTTNQSVYIVHGGTQDELVHAKRFPRVKGIRHFILPHHNHNLSRKLKQKGHLKLLINYAIRGRSYKFKRLIEKNGGMFIQQFEEANHR